MQKNIQKIVVMGLGYIGLPTASMMATKGHQIVGVDVSAEIVATINSGRIHIIEPDLDILVRSAVNSGNLKASLTPEAADTFIIAVPTPFRTTEDNPFIPDISCVEAAAHSIAPFLNPGNLVILESTSPVGTTERIREIIHELRPDLFGTSQFDSSTTLSAGSNSSQIYIAHCPERVLPGKIIRELVDNDRIIGGIDRPSATRARDLYKSFCSGEIFLTDARTAELAKLTENTFRDVNIAFANELSMICERLGINVWDLIELANRHPRVNILKPGPGVGGHCIAVDPWFIVAAAPEQSQLIKAARQVNDSKPHWVVERVRKRAERFVNPVIGCLGLAYKADVDDIRESPAMEITRQIQSLNIGRVMVCEPYVSSTRAGIQLNDLNSVIREADILVVLVDHADFMEIDRDLLKEKVVIDTRGIWR